MVNATTTTWTYKGCNITRIRHNGMYETYVSGRFVKSDTLAGIKALIRKLS